MRDNFLRIHWLLRKNGVTLIELLVAMVICGIVIAGIYRLFISQTKAYTVQDQVAEIQQDVRGAMEIMVRDIRLAGYHSRSFTSAAITDSPIVTPLNSNSITVNYESIATGGIVDTITYTLAGGDLTRTRNAGVQETLLTNVTTLDFTYGIDENSDGIIDGIDGETGMIPDSACQTAATVNAMGTVPKIFSVRIALTANTTSPDPEVINAISPRTLTSVVTPRNIYIQRFMTY